MLSRMRPDGSTIEEGSNVDFFNKLIWDKPLAFIGGGSSTDLESAVE